MRYIGIITLLVLCLTLLLLTGCITNTVTPEIDNGNLESQTVEEPSVEESAVEESATEESATEKADTTKPVIAGSRAPLPNSFGWNNTDVTVSFSCTDDGPVQSGIDINTVAGETVTTEGKDQSVTNTGTCTDVAGNTADPVTVSNINIDKTPPVVTITLPGTGEYVLNQSITATWSATDALSGVVSPVSGSVSIDTSSVGTKTFTLPAGTAKDKADNSSLKVTKSYSVIEDTEDPETEISQKWSGLGINVGFDGISGGDLSYLSSLGINKIRLALPTYNVEHYYGDMQTWVVDLLNAGFHVIWGVTAGPDFTGAQWTAYKTEVQYLAAWAETLNNSNFEFQIGNEEETRNNGLGAPDDATILTDLKALAATCQSIYTKGPISYAVSFIDGVDAWCAAGITPGTDLDKIGLNTYSADARWDDTIDDWATAFGSNGYITEFNYGNMDGDPITEAEQAIEITTMLNYIKASGMTRAFFYCWHDWEGGLYGAVKDDGTYRLLWSQALLNSGSAKFATVSTKTTTISLPDTIALIPKITR